MAQTIKIEAAGCALRPFERNRYFFGKAMTVRDFTAEQIYANEKRQLLNRLIHGSGAVIGLKVELEREPSGAIVVKINPGVALDCCGREIVVSEAHRIANLKDLPGFQKVKERKEAFLCLRYNECVRELVSKQSGPTSCADVCDYNRIRESFEVVLETTAPSHAPLCEERKILFDNQQFLVERVSPVFVRLNETFKVQLQVTSMIERTEPLTIRVEEMFPDGRLGVLQGLGADNGVELILTGPIRIGQIEIKSYLLRADGEAGDARIQSKVTVGSGPAGGGKEESRVGITSEPLSVKLVEKFFANRMDLRPQCDEPHSLCLARLTFTINDAADITNPQVFPQPPLVYNNALLYELIACAEDRLGLLPDLHVSDNDVEMLAVANRLNFLDGLRVETGGQTQANIKVQVDRGLKIEGDKVALNLGPGLEIPGSGDSEDKLAANLGDGLKFSDSDELTADLGKGLTYDGKKIAADLGAGLVFKGNEIMADLGAGQGIKDNKIAANVGNGLKIANNLIQPNYGVTKGMVCEADDPRLHDARTPKEHGSTHKEGGEDEILGVLKDAQKVEVWKDGAQRGTQTVLNFTGNVSVDNDSSATPQRINIDIAKVTTGLVVFEGMSEGEEWDSPEISHGLETGLVAFVVGLEDADGKNLFFGDLNAFIAGNPLPNMPQLVVSCATAGSRKFVMRVHRKQESDKSLMNYRIRWWAIPMTKDLGKVVVPPAPKLTRVKPEIIGLGTPGIDITVEGTGFIPNSVALWQGLSRETEFISSTKLKVRILSMDLTFSGSKSVSVLNPMPGGGGNISKPLFCLVTL